MMSIKLQLLSLLPYALSLLIGSLPIGLLLALAQGIDVRQQGSGNIGATNVARVVNKTTGILTLLLDLLKGSVAVLAIPYLFVTASPATCGLFVVVGHCYSVFLKGKGGKGVATSLGVFICLSPLNSTLATMAFVIAFAISRYVSLGSIVASLTMISLVIWEWASSLMPDAEAMSAIAVALLVILRHSSNIGRLIKGTESKFGMSKNGEKNGAESNSGTQFRETVRKQQTR